MTVLNEKKAAPSTGTRQVDRRALGRKVFENIKDPDVREWAQFTKSSLFKFFTQYVQSVSVTVAMEALKKKDVCMDDILKSQGFLDGLLDAKHFFENATDEWTNRLRSQQSPTTDAE